MILPGQNIQACISCSNTCTACSDKDQSIQTITKTFTVIQNPAPLCTHSLSQKVIVPKKEFKYEDPPLAFKTKTDIFDTNDLINCPITSCVLKTPGCASVYTKTDVVMKTTGDFEVEIATTKVAGG